MWLGETKIKVNFKIIYDSSLKVILDLYLCCLFIPLTSSPITNITINGDLICTLGLFSRTENCYLASQIQSSNILLSFSPLLALNLISYLLHKLVLHISIRFLCLCSIPDHGNCFLLVLF